MCGHAATYPRAVESRSSALATPSVALRWTPCSGNAPCTLHEARARSGLGRLRRPSQPVDRAAVEAPATGRGEHVRVRSRLVIALRWTASMPDFSRRDVAPCEAGGPASVMRAGIRTPAAGRHACSDRRADFGTVGGDPSAHLGGRCAQRAPAGLRSGPGRTSTDCRGPVSGPVFGARNTANRKYTHSHVFKYPELSEKRSLSKAKGIFANRTGFCEAETFEIRCLPSSEQKTARGARSPFQDLCFKPVCPTPACLVSFPACVCSKQFKLHFQSNIGFSFVKKDGRSCFCVRI